MKLPQGKYLVLKDPNKPALILYDIPSNSFDPDDESDEDDIEEEEEAEG
jgi:translation initiation factor 3 subunit D